MRATVGVPEPTWRLSASAGDRPVEHRQRLMMESSLTTCRAADSAFRVSTSGARQAIVQTSPLQSFGAPACRPFRGTVRAAQQEFQ